MRETLSPREDRVFALIAAGCSTKQIAHDLGVHMGSVSVLSHRLKRKLKARNAVEVALRWHGANPAEALAFARQLKKDEAHVA